MNKLELIDILAARLGTTRSESERMLNTLIAIIYETLRGNGKVNISGFGQFMVSYRKARLGVNPRQPSVRITIPELQTPKFRAGEAFKDAVKLRKSSSITSTDSTPSMAPAQ